MERKSKKIWIIGGLVLCLVAVIGITFAFFSTGGTQNTANTFTSGCLNIELTDASASINLTNTYPISDVEGVDSTSYDFTIRNTCDTSTNYSINLESLNQVANSLNADYIKVSLSSDTFDNVISKLSANTEATPEIDNAYESYTLYTGNLGANETKTYHLKLWIDYDATVEQAANKTYSSKINVIANPETSVVDTLEAKFTLDDKTLTSSLSSNVTSATYCTTTTNICEPITPATITSNSYTVELEENDNNQMVCTKLNGTSKVICSNGLEVKTLLGGEYILASANPPTGQTTDWAGGTTYYYTWNPNNWIQFGTNSSGQSLYWRIIRVNGDGTIRIIYNGPTTEVTSETTQISESYFNNGVLDNAYVGYMYQSGQLHGLEESSTIKGVLDNWYINNIADEADYIDGNAGFCGDRRVSSGTGIGSTSTTYYQPYTRLINSSSNLSCEDADIYTTSGSSTGNKSLQYPIGLVTIDEVVLAGITYNNVNTGSYLYTGQDYWTMSPSFYDSSGNGYAYVFAVNDDGYPDYRYVNRAWGVRPVINLKSAIPLSGSGTTSDPFKVVGA